MGVVLNDMKSDERREQYSCDITYVTNNELGFDYLRDNMVIYKEQLVLRELHYAIIDEVDSVLVDEARTPLIISGQSGKSTKRLTLPFHLHMLFCLNSLMKPVRITPPRHDPPCEFINNQYLLVLHHIILIPEHQVMRNKFDKKAGMTGTALTEEKEFRDIYGMDVIEIPTNMPVVRKDLQDAVYKTKKEKVPCR